jgi:hypothetical protein
VTRFDVAVNREFYLRDRAVPNLVIAFAGPVVVTTRLSQFILKLSCKSGHSRIALGAVEHQILMSAGVQIEGHAARRLMGHEFRHIQPHQLGNAVLQNRMDTFNGLRLGGKDPAR